MLRLVLVRILGAIVTLLLSSLLVFFILRLAPGDPIELIYGQITSDIGVDGEMLEELKAEKRREYGLDLPFHLQYARWLASVLRLDLGSSIRTGRPVTTELARRIGPTLALSLSALGLELIFCLALGIYSAMRAGRKSDSIIRVLCVFFSSMPAFAVALASLFFFSVARHVYRIDSSFSLDRLWLPSFVLAILGSPEIIRLIRSSILAEAGKDYIRAFHSLGVGKKDLSLLMTRNAMLPIVTSFAFSFTGLIGGSVVVESIFSWPGLGSYIMNSILIMDYPILQAYMLLVVSAVITVNCAVDIIYLCLDPKLKSRSLA